MDRNYPWDHKTGFAPDNQVPGSLVNLGQTGARAKLDVRSLEVRYVFTGSPADGKLKVGTNVIAVHCRHTGGGQYIDLGVIGKRMPKE